MPARCHGCSTEILKADEACQASGNIYHTNCFMCCSCGRTLKSKAYYCINGRIYCEEDYKCDGFQDTAIHCKICDHIVQDTILEAQGHYYHPGCFKCSQCNECLANLPFTERDDKIYCLKDYYELYAPTCFGCGEAILPVEDSDQTVKVVAMDKDFHVDCYHCEACGMQLTDEPEKRCYPLDDHLLCQHCHLQWIKFGSNFLNGSADSSKIRSQNSAARINSQIVLDQVKRDSIHGDCIHGDSIQGEVNSITNNQQMMTESTGKTSEDEDGIDPPWIRKGIMKIRSTHMQATQNKSSVNSKNSQQAQTHKDSGEFIQGRSLKMSLPRQLYFGSDEELIKPDGLSVVASECKARVRIMEPETSTIPKNGNKSATLQNNNANNCNSSSLERRKNGKKL
jgi:LIM domain-containing protein